MATPTTNKPRPAPATAPAPTAAPKTAHKWNFYRAGGVDQARIDTGADLLAIPDLDQKLWVALSCPTHGLEFDERTLDLIDIDKDHRVRANEIIESIKFVGPLLKDADELTKSSDALPLTSINDATPEGKRILASAKRILDSLGKPAAKAVSVADATQTALIFKQAKFNGDGIVPPVAVDDADARKVAEEVVACLGGEMDRSGNPGFTQDKLDQFFKDCAAYSEWWKKADAEAQKILPLGDNTVPALDAMQAIKAKVDDYFARCRLAAYDPRAMAALNREETAYLAIAAKDLSITAQEVAGFPLSQVAANKPLPLSGAINPAWTAALTRLRDLAVLPLLGKDRKELTEADWEALTARFAPYQAWLAAKAGTTVEKLGVKRVREILAGKAREVLADLVAQDKAVEPEMNAITNVEKLVRLYRDLFILVNNFVSFTDFYSQRRKAIFQAGTLYLDGRSCELVVRVHDAGKHGTMAVMAKSYLAYCDCTRPGSEKMTVAAAFSAGDSDHLMVGRNGVFYDRKGRDWDVTITRIVDNPISIGQAFWAPYKKFLRWIEETIAKRAAAADEAATGKLQAAATETGEAAKAGKAAEPKKLDLGVIALISTAISGVAVTLGSLMSNFFGLGVYMPLGVVGIILGISGPSMLIAYMKLRQRNLGPILDANGWAVNGRVKVNIPLGGALTKTATMPEGATRSLVDPYAEKKSPWPKVIVTLVLIAALVYGLFRMGFLYDWASKIVGVDEKGQPKASWVESLKPPAKEAEKPK